MRPNALSPCGWKAEVSEALRLKAPEDENAERKWTPGDSILGSPTMRFLPGKRWRRPAALAT